MTGTLISGLYNAAKILSAFMFIWHFWRFETRNDVKSGFLMIIFAILMR